MRVLIGQYCSCPLPSLRGELLCERPIEMEGEFEKDSTTRNITAEKKKAINLPAEDSLNESFSIFLAISRSSLLP